MRVEQLVEQLLQLPQYYEVAVDVTLLAHPSPTDVVLVYRQDEVETAPVVHVRADTDGHGPVVVLDLEQRPRGEVPS